MASVPSGGAGAAPAAGGAAASGGAAAEEKVEEKAEGMFCYILVNRKSTNPINREGRVRRGHGFRSFRLSSQLTSHGLDALDLPEHRFEISGRNRTGFAHYLHAIWDGLYLAKVPMTSTYSCKIEQ